MGRVHFVHPSAGDRFFLRLLLYHVKGPGSEAELFVVDGDTHLTFKAAALARGGFGRAGRNDFIRGFTFFFFQLNFPPYISIYDH